MSLRGYCSVKGGGGVTEIQLDLPSTTPLSVAGCVRLQLEVVHWANSATLQSIESSEKTVAIGTMCQHALTV